MDYTKADIHNPTWWKHWRFLIESMEESDYGDLLRRAYEFQLALVSNSRISADDFSSVQKEAKEIFRDIEGVSRPWVGRTKQDRKRREAEDFKEQWEALAGFSPDDKEALDLWSQEIQKHTDATKERRVKEEQEAMTRHSRFYDRIDEIRQKRLKQQGRKE